MKERVIWKCLRDGGGDWMRCIDADALAEEWRGSFYEGTVESLLNTAPTIESRCETCEAFGKTKLLIPQPQRTGRWIDHVEDGYVECPFCHSATNCDDNISELHFCFSCGARMEG